MKKTLKNFQISAVQFLKSTPHALLADEMGLGKAQPLTAKVLTPSGWVRMGTLSPGDEIVNDYGGVSRVTGVYPQGRKEIFEVTLSDGASTICCAEHLWDVTTPVRKQRGSGFITLPLKELAEKLHRGRIRNRNWFLPLPAPIYAEEGSFLISPYIMGALLGDGGLSQNRVSFTSADAEILDRVRAELPRGAVLVEASKIDFRVAMADNVLRGNSTTPNIVTREIASLGLSGRLSRGKFIPEKYLWGAPEQRLDLLRGLLDTDGFCGEDGHVDFYSVSLPLAEGVVHLVRSLGGVARIRGKSANYRGRKVMSYRVVIRMAEGGPNPFYLARKAKRYSPTKYHATRSISSVRSLGCAPVQCISTSAVNQRYITDDFIVTHNTVTALAAAEAVGAKSVLVVCPASVRLNWRQEAEECGTLFPLRFDVISYHGASSPVIRRELARSYDLLILDEAHFLKTPESRRTQAVFGNGEMGLARRCRRVWCLTGTPVLNRPRELYPILKVLHSKALGAYASWERFASRYCGAYWDGYAINTKGASHIDELAAILKGFMLRREKAEVLPELPPRIVNRPPLDLARVEAQHVFELESEIANREAYLSPTHEDFAQLGDISKLLHAVGLAKVRALVDFVNETFENGEKVVIFARHRDVISSLATQLGGDKAVVYHGGLNDIEKGKAVSRFVNEDGVKFFIGQIAAAGTGINGLQKVASNVVFAELSWVPGEMAQAIDRCHRIGQSASAVNVYLPHVPGTLESAMLQVQAAKSVVIERLVGRRE